MDLWVVAAVAGAGYLAKYLSGESELSSGIRLPGNLISEICCSRFGTKRVLSADGCEEN